MWQKHDLHLIKLHSPLIGLHCAFILQHQLFLVIQLLFGDGIARPRRLISRQVHLRLGKQVFISLECSLRFQQLRAIGPRIDVN